MILPARLIPALDSFLVKWVETSMSESHVVERDLNFDSFSCCGNEDLYPFKCSRCGWLMVFCYECDTLYRDLRDLSLHERDINHFDPDKSIFTCPKCGHAFEYYFMKNPAYHVTAKEWIDAGFGHLLHEGRD
jgi:hypothetical protein